MKGLKYQMPKKMFDAILKTRNAEDKKLNPYTFMVRYINTHFGLKGTVKRVTVLI